MHTRCVPFRCDDCLHFQAHKLEDRIHDIDLESLDGKTVSEVRQ